MLTQEKTHQVEGKEIKNPTSHNIHEWSFLWKPTQLGLPNQRSL